MESREQVYDLYVSGFHTYVMSERYKNPSFYPDQNSIIESINRTFNQYKELPNFELSEEERAIVINRIETLYSIFQDEGTALLGNYEHDYEWYSNLLLSSEYKEYFWTRYKTYLINNKHFAPSVMETLENKTMKSIMSYLGNPNDPSPFSIRGLVVGDVQSGKTSNYIGLLTKAADAGYKVIFILTGTIEGLRKQTQERVEEGFVGFDSVNGVDVGVGRGVKMPKTFTNRAKDFTGTDNQNTTYNISNYSSEPMIFVVKKNVPVLRKIFASLKKINTSRDHQRIDYPMLMIDDEADNASINTNKPDNDPTQINKYIRSILSLFTRTSYVGFTATPFANVFISFETNDEMLGNDLFPKDFIYALNAPSNYCGSHQYFFESNENVRHIIDDDQNVFPLSHKKDWSGCRLFGSLYHAINTFLLSNAIRDIRDSDPRTHRSMLINMSRFTRVQSKIKDIVESYFHDVLTAVKQTHKLDINYAQTNDFIQSLKTSFDKEYSNIYLRGKPVQWEEVFRVLLNAIKNIQIAVVNSSKQSEKLDYEKYKNDGLRIIAIGGLALSRGLTLESLTVSYFYRNTSTFDVLMQMGRWFGYRDGYADLCKIFITPSSAEYYKEICTDIDYLKDDIKTMCLQHKKPEEYGVRVRNASLELKITASNKMRNTRNKIVRKSFYGNIFETPYLHRDLNIINNNIIRTIDFFKEIKLSSRDRSILHPYFKDISKSSIQNLLSTLEIHGANENFDKKQLLSFLEHEDKELEFFDVLVMGGSSHLKYKYDALDIHMNLIIRKFDIKDNGVEKIVRINASRTRLMGRADAKHGLSIEQERFIHDNARSQDYMIKGRNPLLIIYFVDLRNDASPNNLDIETTEFMLAQGMMEYKFVVGYAIGFPFKEGEDSRATLYTVNSTINYFDRDHDISREDEDNE